MIIADEINGLINSNLVNTLRNDVNNNNATGSIENFNTESQAVLKGEAWDGVRNKLDEFDIALQKSKNVGSDLLNTINDILDEYKLKFGDFNEESLDVTLIPEIENSIIAAKRGITELQGQLNSTVLKTVIVNGEEQYVSVSLFEGEPDRYNAIKALIANCEEQIAKLEVKLAKLQELKAFIEVAEVKLKASMESVNEYQQMVDGIVVSKSL